MLFGLLRGLAFGYPAEYFVNFLLIIEFLSKVILQIFNFNSFLFHCVTITNCNTSIVCGFEIYRNTEWFTNRILTTITFSNALSIIICYAKVF